MALWFKFGYSERNKRTNKQDKMMMKFIYVCVAIILLSFLIVPMISGVSNERDAIAEREIEISSQNQDSPSNDTLSFTEIYDLADDNNANIATAEALNNIAPAAGGESEIPPLPEDFSNQVAPTQNPAF